MSVIYFPFYILRVPASNSLKQYLKTSSPFYFFLGLHIVLQKIKRLNIFFRLKLGDIFLSLRCFHWTQATGTYTLIGYTIP